MNRRSNAAWVSPQAVKCVARGTGSARTAAEYLVGERDATGQVRAGVEVLRGDPDMVAAVADSLDFEHKYRSLVIAWAPEGRPSDAQIGAVLDEFEKDGVGGTGAGPLRLDGGPAPGARRWGPRARPHRTVRPGDRPQPEYRAPPAGRRPSTRCATPSTTSTAGAARTTRRGPGRSSPAIAPTWRRRSCGPASNTKPARVS